MSSKESDKSSKSLPASATDAAGNIGTASFTVSVNPPPDTTPPTVTVPEDIVVTAISADGAEVTFAVTAEYDVDGTATLDGNGLSQDDVGGDIAIDCTLPPGTIFPVGSTDVECTATDAAGNTARDGFSIDTRA